MDSSIPTQTPNKSSGYIAILGVIIAIVIVAVGVLVYKAYKHSNLASLPYSQNSANKVADQTPTVTEQNAPTVLDQTGAAIESDINQVNTDLQTLDQNNASADNPNNL